MLLMNNESKLTISDEELQLVNNSAWILTKHIIIDKVYFLFGKLSQNMKLTFENEMDWLPPEIKTSEPKITKGENYLQLPYVILDYPRRFEDQNIFAVRTMFWWGNFFSVSLQLSGKYKKIFENKLINNGQKLGEGYFICVNESQWQHSFTTDNYKAIQQLTKGEFEKLVKKKEFVKLAIHFPLHQWNDLPELLDQSFNALLGLLKT